MTAARLDQRIANLAERFSLPAGASAQLQALLRHLVEDPAAPTSIRDADKAIDDHLADSLVALELEQVRRAVDAIDIGSGAGLPGLALAIAMPYSGFTLIESAARKCAFLRRVIDDCGLTNAQLVHARVEEWVERREEFDLATARAVAPLPVVVEYAAPLLKVGGCLVVWQGRRDPTAEEAAARAGARLGIEPGDARRVTPFPAARHRYLHLMLKVRTTPLAFPRRPGVALKRPLGG